jgi:hypothetical protein
VPEPLKLVEGTLKGLGQAVRLRQQQAHRRQGRLALPGVVLGGDIAHAADGHAPAGIGVLDLVEAGRDPEPAPIAVRDGHHEAALSPVYEGANTSLVWRRASRSASGCGHVARIFELTGLDKIMLVHRDVQQSLDTPRAEPRPEPGG